MEKNLKKDQKVAKILSSSRALVRVKDEIRNENENLSAILDTSAVMPASVDISTMRRLPWIDFNTILESTESTQREQVILNLLQNNVSSSADDIYYIDHDAQTNTFSIKVDESSDEIQDFIEGILVIDAQLKVQDLSDKERKMLIRKIKLKIQELRSAYGAKEAADVLDKKLSEQEKAELEERIIEI